MTEKKLATIERQARDGAEADAILAGSVKVCPTCQQHTSIFQERKTQIVDEAIQWFETPGASSDTHVAVRYIAALAEILRLQRALEYRSRKGVEAKAALYAGKN